MPSTKCGANKTDGSGTCGQAAGWGTDHVGYGRCKKHGGATQSSTKHARKLQAQDAVATYGLAREVDPHDALLEEVHRTAGHVAWLGQVVESLEKKALTHGITKTMQKADGSRDVTAEAAVNVWVKLYQDERDRLIRVARSAIEAGVAERTVKLAEDQAKQLAAVVSAVLTDLGHDLKDEGVRSVVRLRMLQGGKAA